jgi:hypothetical protein
MIVTMKDAIWVTHGPGIGYLVLNKQQLDHPQLHINKLLDIFPQMTPHTQLTMNNILIHKDNLCRINTNSHCVYCPDTTFPVLWSGMESNMNSLNIARR